MPRTVGIGIQSFETLRTQDLFYIDKTNFIKEWWENADATTLITRPRRFGKTLNMDTLNCFFSNDYENRADLFEGLSIWNEEKYRQLQGTYPVIFLSFAAIKTGKVDEIKVLIKDIIRCEYDKYRYIGRTDELEDSERAYFDEITDKMSDSTAYGSLNRLCKYLYKHFGKKPIILLDEYDTPMQEAFVGGCWDEIVDFMRSLFNATFKTNPYLERAVITGITRVSKESIFSDLNHLKVITTSSEAYASCFGFSENEVKEALKEYDLSDKFEEVKSWYDGFKIGNLSDIYNPWSMINFLDEKKLDNYWINSSGNKLINDMLQKGDAGTKIILEKLMHGETFEAQMNEDIVFGQLDTEKNAIWSLMLASGYLKAIHIEFQEEDDSIYTLQATNKETIRFFRNMVSKWFSNCKGGSYSDFIESFLEGDLEEMNLCMNDITENVFSYYDVGNGKKWKQAESFYHGFVLGLMVDLSKEYTMKSNRESGRGRYDVMLIPKGDQDAFILGFKAVRDDKKETLEGAMQMALKQIEDKNYEQEFVSAGIPKERIKKYGFAFEGKTVLIGTEQ